MQVSFRIRCYWDFMGTALWPTEKTLSHYRHPGPLALTIFLPTIWCSLSLSVDSCVVDMTVGAEHHRVLNTVCPVIKITIWMPLSILSAHCCLSTSRGLSNYVFLWRIDELILFRNNNHSNLNFWETHMHFFLYSEGTNLTLFSETFNSLSGLIKWVKIVLFLETA